MSGMPVLINARRLLILSLIGLTACGGGGGGGGGGTGTGSSGGSSGSSSGGSSSGPIADYAVGGSLSLYSGSLGGYGFANGSGSSARFDEAYAIARDAATGDMYVADYFSHTIRKVSSAGVASTFAGKAYYKGHIDGSATSARFSGPAGVAFSNGTLYVADMDDHTVRKISNDVVSTLAGSTGVAGNSDGSGTAARFNTPRGLAVDSFGNLFVTDTDSHTIRKITGTGVSTFAGSAGLSGVVDGAGSSARFSSPRAITVDGSNNLYVGDYSGIRKITAAGAVTTATSMMALVTAGCSGTISALAVDSSSNLYVSNYSRICKVASNGTVTLLAGNGEYNAADGTGSAASVYTMGMTINAAGDTLYLADNYAVRQLAITTGVVTSLAGKGFGNRYGHLDGAVASAQYKQPYGIAADATGRLIVADLDNSVVRRIDSGTVSTLAGTPGTYFSTTDGTGSAARFYLPTAVATDTAGNAYVLDGNAVRKITPAGVVTTLAGNASTAGNADASGTAASFRSPNGLTVDAAGNVFVADTGNNSIRKITPAGVVSTFAGSTAGLTGSVDGSGTAARFSYPADIISDASGNLYVADANNATVRKITPAGVVTTLTGSAGAFGYIDGALSSARFNAPTSIAIDAASNLYVGDSLDLVVRKISTAGQVTTVVGSSRNRWIAEPGAVSGNLNGLHAMTVIGKKLYMTTENAILVTDLP
ncbi:hypothetical protein Q9Q94_05225 [Uliginosibacterium sp. 31-16]|uniref:hypothetical protein n=1 Tax=Uliginosibacterium sp. 31-16 TaxID=3068315 RepID=UPI00273E6E7B|nr:hypothetical protein [Uliginosibacterium sp. 31-16]MDP5238919.1 hypothetical protein [Uliginosibacterium sp. 31-16]